MSSFSLRTAVIVLAGAVAAAALAAAALHLRHRPAEDAASERPEVPRFRYDVEYPAIRYTETEPTARVARLAARLGSGETTLAFRKDRGYLEDLLRALDIDPSSQALVFSKTSLQTDYVSPETPRAIYFNDDTYVAWEQGGPVIEIASLDPSLGFVFYTLRQSAPLSLGFVRQTTNCLRCHDTYELTGGGVPRLLLGSGYIGAKGDLVSHEGWILTTDETPLESRWGGWYVSGHHGDQVHLGNIVVHDPAELQHLEKLRIGNLDDLDALLDTKPYLTNKSDIVALLVLQHQATVQNLLVRASFDARQAQAAGSLTPATLDAAVEPLVRAMLFVGAAKITAPIEGNSGFRQRFEASGPRDAQGRSLRELDLTTRLFRYPLSFLIYSDAFDALPDAVKARVYERLAEILTGADPSKDFASLSPEDRRAILEILRATKPDFAAAAARLRPLKTA
ncbi:MAG TPA: hypothetical protein VFV10_16225 [Gammaproteobacteria bacterium]|nr:hypothetical protein [Gammaproteobacteria bacterium]